MNYARWATNEEMKSILTPVNLETGVKKSGIPLMYDDKYLYINDNAVHSLIIGSTGSGKTQATILPVLKLAMMAEESVVITDPKGELYERTCGELTKRDYNIITLNFDNSKKGNSYNPLTLPYKLYKGNELDKSIALIENLGYYLFVDPKEKNLDSFWNNSTIDYFTGVTLYLFENGKEEEINLSSVYNIGNQIEKLEKREEFLNKLDKNSSIYYYVSGTLQAPLETKGGILATFNQKMKKYLGKENLNNMLATSDFDITNITKEKTALFIIGGHSIYSDNLTPLLVEQVIEAADTYGDKVRRLNMILDEFDYLLPIKNFEKVINYSRSINVKFTVAIKTYLDLINTYGKEDAEMIKLCFGNIIYLLSNDIYTLEEISKLCGNEYKYNTSTPLITVEELRTLKIFEAVIISQRMMPFKTKMLPDYQIDWKFSKENIEIPERVKNEVKVYEI